MKGIYRSANIIFHHAIPFVVVFSSHISFFFIPRSSLILDGGDL